MCSGCGLSMEQLLVMERKMGVNVFPPQCVCLNKSQQTTAGWGTLGPFCGLAENFLYGPDWL